MLFARMFRGANGLVINDFTFERKGLIVMTSLNIPISWIYPTLWINTFANGVQFDKNKKFIVLETL